MCLTSADSQNWCVFLRFAVQGSLCPRRHWEWQQGLHNQVHVTKRACAIFPYNENISADQYAPARMGPSTVINHFCDHTWLENAVPFILTPFRDNIHLCNSHHLKRFVALLSDFFFCTELWFCCWMQNNSQGWQTSGEPVLDINLWFSGKTHLKCKNCYWEHIVMIHHVNICLAA